jgi:hypothetical protein
MFGGLNRRGGRSGELARTRALNFRTRADWGLRLTRAQVLTRSRLARRQPEPGAVPGLVAVARGYDLSCRVRIAGESNSVTPRGIENFGEIHAARGVVIEVVINGPVAIPGNIDMDRARSATAGEMDVTGVAIVAPHGSIHACIVEPTGSNERQGSHHECRQGQ